MTTYAAPRNQTFELDDTSTAQQNLSTYVRRVDFPFVRRLIEVTSLGDTGRKFIPGLQETRFTVDYHWSTDASVGPDTVNGKLVTHTAAVDFEYGPEGNAQGDIMYTGTCWVETWQITGTVGDRQTGTATYVVEGAVSRGAHA